LRERFLTLPAATQWLLAVSSVNRVCTQGQSGWLRCEDERPLE